MVWGSRTRKAKKVMPNAIVVEAKYPTSAGIPSVRGSVINPPNTEGTNASMRHTTTTHVTRTTAFWRRLTSPGLRMITNAIAAADNRRVKEAMMG